METAIFGGGCFWCTEAIFQRVKGVKSVESGYAGGQRANPTYEQVSSEATGHAEVIKVEYDPAVITYDELLDVFFHVHDPTTMNRQGADAGTQYRSVVFYNSDAQKQAAEAIIKKLTDAPEFNSEIVTQVLPLDTFYKAEDYHQNYFNENKNKSYCQIVIAPKLQKFLEKYATKVATK